MPEQIPLIDPASTPAWQRLEELAAEPFDLTPRGALSPRRIRSMASTVRIGDDPLRLLYATERVTAKVVSALGQLARQTEAVRQFG